MEPVGVTLDLQVCLTPHPGSRTKRKESRAKAPRLDWRLRRLGDGSGHLTMTAKTINLCRFLINSMIRGLYTYI